ncbi:hypothetical protein BJ322DRAFT_583744 [Thelephora terrestris]|uniref:Uncharacterized protein n=1 Tax=Thelephora terrestris TaxID=56493 RepID=A0A9P6L9B0_9AGAM|nr:hypothetical protein BJ322DRAFT_583744 [Thelephora terrestris]
MATLTDSIDIQPTTPNPDFEPDERWKADLRQRIEDTLKPSVEGLKRELNEKLKGLSPPEDSKAHTDYDNAMAELRRKATEKYAQVLERERQERRWAAGEKVDQKWADIFVKEQQALFDMYKRGAIAKNNQPEPMFRDEERSQPPPSAKAPDRATLPPESLTKDRMRRPSTILTEPIPEDDPPARPSLEDREPRPYSNTGSWSRRSNGRDRSASFGSPPRPEIWKPTSNESPSSRTIAHAAAMNKPRRDSSASIGTTSSFPATIPEDTSLSIDKDQDGEKLWGDMYRSRQKALVYRRISSAFSVVSSTSDLRPPPHQVQGIIPN